MESTSMFLKFSRFLIRVAFIAVLFINFVAQAQSLKTTRNKNYTKPMYFDVFGTLPQPPEVQVIWDLESHQGTKLKMGPITIDEKNLSFGHRRLKDLDPLYQGMGADTPYLLVNFPEFLFQEARLEIISRDGAVVWARDIVKSEIENWQKFVQSAVKFNRKTPFLQVEWGLESSVAGLPFDKLADEFRFCLSHFGVGSQERLCSQKYVVRKMGSQLLLGRIKSTNQARVLLNGESVALKGSQPVSRELPTRFYAELVNGESFEFASKPREIKWADFVLVSDSTTARVIGYETPPIGKYQILNPIKHSKWIQKFHFEPTIGDKRKFWSFHFKQDEPWVYFTGEIGGLFRHRMPVEQAPQSEIQLHLSKNTPTGTYRDKIVLKGRKQPQTHISSEEHRAEETKDPTLFNWVFKAQKTAELNRSSLLLQDGDKSYKAYYELYKGYANELSARSSMVISDKGLIMMGEASYNHWFEDVLGWDHYYLTKQRWGLSGRYFQSFTEFKTSDLGNTRLKVTNLDLKYRFTPGLWTRDESQGAMISYQDLDVDVELTKFKVPMVGIGWFWARSMPQVFDEVFNLLPFMNYPKWVDMEFIYYGGTLDSRNKLDVNFALNFHGQVLWEDNFFGEAGFGIKRYAFVDTQNPFQTSGIGYSLNTLYGTVGIGFKF